MSRPRPVPWLPFVALCSAYACALVAALLWTPDDLVGGVIVAAVLVAFPAALYALGRWTQR